MRVRALAGLARSDAAAAVDEINDTLSSIRADDVRFRWIANLAAAFRRADGDSVIEKMPLIEISSPSVTLESEIDGDFLRRPLKPGEKSRRASEGTDLQAVIRSSFNTLRNHLNTHQLASAWEGGLKDVISESFGELERKFRATCDEIVVVANSIPRQEIDLMALRQSRPS